MNVLEFANSRLWERQMETSPSGQSSYNPLARLTSSLIQPDSASPTGQSTADSASTPNSAPKPPTPHPCPACDGILYYSFDPSGRPKKCMSCSPPQRLGYEQWIIAVDEGGEWICVPHWVSARRHFLMSRVECGELDIEKPPRWIDADDFTLACGGWRVSDKKLEWGRAWRDKSALLKWCRTVGIDVDDAVVGVNWAKNSSGGVVGGGGVSGGGVSGGSDSAAPVVGAAKSAEVAGIANANIGNAKPSGKGKSNKSSKSGKGKSSGSSLPAGPSLFGDDGLMGGEHL